MKTTTKTECIAALGALLLAISCAAAPEIDQRDVYVGGEGGYASYRIPAIVASKKGTLLAFAEGRRDGAGDAGRIDTILRRSTDAGDTWGDMAVVWSDGANTC